MGKNINILDLGAIGDGKTLNTEILQNAIDQCSAAGGGKVIVSGGTYMTGSIQLKDNVNLHIESDAVLLGSPKCSDYPERENVKHVHTPHLPRWRNACLIFADECTNIAITGSGTIDCNGENFVVKREGDKVFGWAYERIKEPTPPRAVFLAGCKHVRIEGITMINQPAGWSYWISDCDYVVVDKINIIANVDYPNNDGLHINCSRNVTVSNCNITCGDDCIVVRANSYSLKENKICEKVVVTNCNLTSYSGGVRIGWVNDGTIRNCTFSNLVMTDTSVGISLFIPYMKRNPDDFNTADMGREATHVENITFDNIIMDKTASNPVKIYITPNTEVMVDEIKNLYFNNIHSNGPELIMICGREDCHIKNVHFNNCTFEMTDGSEFNNLPTHGACSFFDSNYHPMELRYVDNLCFNNTKFDIKRY